MGNQLIDREAISNELAEEIKKLVLEARDKISKEVNGTLVNTYWNIGKTIIEFKMDFGDITLFATFK